MFTMRQKCPKCFIHLILTTYEADIITMPVISKWEDNHREVKLAQGYTASKERIIVEPIRAHILNPLPYNPQNNSPW